jgi:hypothetical protein
MELTTSPVCAYSQLEGDTALNVVCALCSCPNLATLRHIWQAYNECVEICRVLDIRNPEVCFPKR